MWLLELITTDQYRAKELIKSGVLLGDPFLELTISPDMEVSIIGKSSESKENFFVWRIQDERLNNDIGQGQSESKAK